MLLHGMPTYNDTLSVLLVFIAIAHSWTGQVATKRSLPKSWEAFHLESLLYPSSPAL